MFKKVLVGVTGGLMMAGSGFCSHDSNSQLKNTQLNVNVSNPQFVAYVLSCWPVQIAFPPILKQATPLQTGEEQNQTPEELGQSASQHQEKKLTRDDTLEKLAEAMYTGNYGLKPGLDGFVKGTVQLKDFDEKFKLFKEAIQENLTECKVEATLYYLEQKLSKAKNKAYFSAEAVSSEYREYGEQVCSSMKTYYNHAGTKLNELLSYVKQQRIALFPRK